MPIHSFAWKGQLVRRRDGQLSPRNRLVARVYHLHTEVFETVRTAFTVLAGPHVVVDAEGGRSVGRRVGLLPRLAGQSRVKKIRDGVKEHPSGIVVGARNRPGPRVAF